MKIKYMYQQLLSHISVIFVAFLVLSLLFAHYVENLVYENKVDELKTYGENILDDIGHLPRAQESVTTQYTNVLSGRNILFSLFDRNGVLITPPGRHVPMIQFTEEEWNKVTRGETLAVKQDIERFEQDVTFVAIPFIYNGQFSGGILLTSPISGSREMISEINRYLFYTVLVALTISLLLSLVLSKIHVNRITRIRDATSMVSSGNYNVHVPSSNYDEIGELAHDFNRMVDKLNDSMEEIQALENRRRQFIADVSHELRTPLTTISGVIEGLKNNMIPDSEKEKGIQLVSKESKRLIRLVNENLDYDKIRSNQIKLHKQELQLKEVLEIIKEQLSIQAEEKNDRIVVQAEDRATIYADYDRLIQILINITKNSIQFTEGGTIRLLGKNEGGRAIIIIEDTGSGIEPAEIEKIWDRFYKADISRTSNPYGEFGLGLSIVKQLVLLHHGDIKVSSEKGKGTAFIIEVPSHPRM